MKKKKFPLVLTSFFAQLKKPSLKKGQVYEIKAGWMTSTEHHHSWLNLFGSFIKEEGN